MVFLPGVLVVLLLTLSARADLEVPKADGDSGVVLAEAVADLNRAFARASKVEVFEGLPHPFEGKEFVKSERLAKSTFELDGQWLYATAHRMPAEDVIAFQRWASGEPFKVWRGVKFCGGFHADYVVQFEGDGATYSVLFCFGCYEARIMRVSAGRTVDGALEPARVTADLAEAKFKELRDLLAKYRSQRPPTPPRKGQVPPPPPPKVPIQF